MKLTPPQWQDLQEMVDDAENLAAILKSIVCSIKSANINPQDEMAKDKTQIEVFEEMFARLSDRLEKIEHRLTALELNDWPATRPPYPRDTNTCPKCGMLFDGVTNYYCSRSDCPMFAKATC